MRVLLCACVLLGSILAVAPATAQSSAAPSLDPESNVLYLHSETGQDMWMNALEVDGAATNICYKAPEPTPLGDLCPNQGESFEYVFDLLPGLPHDLLLDTAGTIDVEIYWGGACCTVGTADYDLSLTSGDVTVASVSGSHLMNPGAVSNVCPNDGCVYNAIRESLTPEVDRIDAAAGLTLSITGSGEWTHAAISTTEARGVSSLTLPISGIVGGGPDLTIIDVPEGTTEIGNTTEAPTNASLLYNWTVAEPLHVSVNGTEGVVAINITVVETNETGKKPAGNQTIYTCQCNGTVEEDVDVEGIRPVCVDANVTPVPCQYAIRIDMQGFNGTVRIVAMQSSQEAEGSPGDAGADGTAPDDGTGGDSDSEADADAGNETLLGGDDQGAPLPFVAAVLAVGLVAWIRRRD